MFCFQSCPVTTTARVTVVGCLLLALFALVRFYQMVGADSRYSSVHISGGHVSARQQATTRSDSNHVTESTKLNDVLNAITLKPHLQGPPTWGNQSGLVISTREACAVASAASTNPDTKVYLLYTCSIVGNLSDSPEYVKQMLSYPNIKIWKMVVADFIKGTPLENWDFMGKVQSSKWPVVHASDILRLTTLWKYGGTYLDLDFVIQKWVSHNRLEDNTQLFVSYFSIFDHR